MMKYFIEYNNENGKILGRYIDTNKNQAKGTLQEVTRSQWKESQGDEDNKFNKIVIDGENISFETFDFRTQDELKEEFKQNRATIMNSIGWIHERIQSQTVLIQGGKTLTAAYTTAQAIEYYDYKQSLRDRPSIITDWTSISYPVVPQHVYDAMEKEIKALCQELQCDPVV